MKKTIYKIKKNGVHTQHFAALKHSYKIKHSPMVTQLDRMTSSELIAVFSKVKAIDKGFAYVESIDDNISRFVKYYCSCRPQARKWVRKSISKTIVERNASENPVTPEMLNILRKTFQ